MRATFVAAGIALRRWTGRVRVPRLGAMFTDTHPPSGRGRRRAAVAALVLGLAGAGAATSTATATTPIAATAVTTAHTADGAVGYRSTGHGSPLVLISGHGGTIDDWDPALVDRLAAHHRVVALDNAGVGRTSMPRGGITIAAMAEQTHALIATLQLRRPTVLGWSEGGMVAQQLAIVDPGDVGSLVLAATYPGDGHGTPIPRRTWRIAADPRNLLTTLFPPDRAAAARAYLRRLGAYPHHETVPASVGRRQNAVATGWVVGDDPVGHRLASIEQRTLVADGAADILAVPANSRRLAGAIPGAQLALYPDAGHAFLFQDAGPFADRIERFLGG